MQKAGPLALVALFVFALAFAFVPTGPRGEAAQVGAQLQGVRLALYPARDEGAVWTFAAGEVRSDPLTNVTQLTQLSRGERLVRGRDAAGRYTGRQTLDATLSTPELTIDAQDDLLTPRARITLVRECADLTLTGTAGRPVRIEQGTGFSAPAAVIDSPNLNGRINDLQMSFQFDLLHTSEDSNYQLAIDPTETCRDGKRVPI
ncbi:hypothetical protein [uncultured Deinococcus sp.]|uniref:hypothetical protein n=1 Tax=uncultured Deinococcus sp. TaxID=158789 RepID=UPI0025884B1C|nr:hypothetical protein [uncultured Deinococcus sp.]